MEKSLYAPAESSLKPIAKVVLEKFGGQTGKHELEFTLEELDKLNFIWHIPNSLPLWMAKMVKTPDYYVCLGVNPLTMVCIKQIFDEACIEVQKAIIFHELSHISYDEKGNYKLRQHDIQDFKALVSKIGLDYENAKIMFGDVE